MRRVCFRLALVLAVFLPRAAHAVPPFPGEGPAPLMFVRFLAPPGVKVTFYPGRAAPRTLAAPVTVGLRPGFIYRFKLSNFPDQPKLKLYPSLEVRNTLLLPKVVRAIDHPAPLAISAEDVQGVLRGSMLTKVVLLEDPELAIATASEVNQPLEIQVAPGVDPLEDARLRGRPLLIQRLGERELTEEEMICRGVPGTIQFPGERYLPLPPIPPPLSYACLPIIDPILGPKPFTEECLHDGGDCGIPAAIDRNGQVQGLDPSDTVAAYTDAHGHRNLTVSNRVCLCVPRFLVVRGETLPIDYESTVFISDRNAIQAHERVDGHTPPVSAVQNEQLEAYRNRERPSGTIAVAGPIATIHLEILTAYHLNIGTGELLDTQGMRKLTGEQRTELYKQIEFAHVLEEKQRVAGVEQLAGPKVVGRVEGVNVIGQVQELRDFTSCCSEMPPLPERPLHLYKWVSTRSAQVGDVVTFFLKFSNLGSKPMSDVAVSDSLTGRLEYIPGSSKANRDAVFTTQDNRAGSLILHWEVSGLLPPGESGVVSFQARIR